MLLGDVLGNLQTLRVDLTMPKFTYEAELGLKDTLKGLGMIDAFDPSLADFSGITADRDLFVQDVVHKAFVKVDEEGTEAAAATGVSIGVTSAPPVADVVLTIDRPFIFLIRDVPTGAILFLGRVTDPT